MTKQTPIPLASPDIQSQDIESAVAVLRSGNLVQGEKVKEFEQALENYLGVQHCVAVTNGTSSLQLILVALGIGAGDEVIVPAFSYIATANVVELVGAIPIFVDIELSTFNIDTSKIEEKITAKTKAVIIVHEFGLSADTMAIKALCDRRKLFLIEDAACALGAKENEIFAGTLGVAGSYSFHPRKAITSGEGGAIVTNDRILAGRLRALRNHGIDPGVMGKQEFVMAGFNCRMTDIQAALLISQLKRFPTILEKKQKIAQAYLSRISNSQITLPAVMLNKKHAWQTFHILLSPPLKQGDVIELLKGRGVGTNYGAQCIPAQRFYLDKYRYFPERDFPNALSAFARGLAIPIYEKLSEHDIDVVVNALNEI
jgi:perosamine synthetase